MNEERKEGGVRHVEPTLLRPITVSVASRADSSLISGLVRAKRPSFPAGPPATRLLSPPLCSREVFLESQQHGDQFLKAAPFSTFQHLSISSSASSSSLYTHCTGSQGPPNHPCWFCGTPPQPTALSSSECPDSWLVLMDHPHQPHTYVQRPPPLGAPILLPERPQSSEETRVWGCRRSALQGVCPYCSAFKVPLQSVSCHCRDKFPHIQWLQRQFILSQFWARSPKWVLLDKDQGVSRPARLLEAPGESLFLCLFQSLDATRIPWLKASSSRSEQQRDTCKPPSDLRLHCHSFPGPLTPFSEDPCRYTGPTQTDQGISP